MRNADEFLRHLRSTHFVLVITSFVIVLGLSSARQAYVLALQQFDDIVVAKPKFSAVSLVKRIQQQAKPPISLKKLNQPLDLAHYLPEIVDEHLELIDLPDVPVYRISIDKLVAPDYVLDFGPDTFLSQNSFFNSNGAILTSKTQRRYYLQDESATTNLSSIKNKLNSLLAFDQLFYSPGYYSYYRDATLFDKDGKPLTSDKVGAVIKSFKKPELSGELTKVVLTGHQDRERFAAASLAASEDPEAWYREKITPDFFILDCRISDRSTPIGERKDKSIRFTMHLPVFFQVAPPRFMGDILGEAFPNRRYHARYLSGARSFAELFPELDELTIDLGSLDIKDLRSYLRRKTNEGKAPMSVLGIQVAQELISVWGLFALLAVQFYFTLHFRNFLNRQDGSRFASYPWIGVYDDAVSQAVFHASLTLPVLACGYLAWNQHQTAGAIKPLTYVAGFLAICLFAATEWILLRPRERREPTLFL